MEIIPGAHAVPGTKISRIYLIEDDDLTLVDTGMPWSAGRIFKYITSIGRQPSELRRILMTHSHPDHTGGAPGICCRSNAQIVAHHDDTIHRRPDTHTLNYVGVFASLNMPIPFLRRTLVDCLSYENEVIPAAGGIRVIHTGPHAGKCVLPARTPWVAFQRVWACQSFNDLPRQRHCAVSRVT